MKKKIVTLALVVALVAVAIVGATLAYFTDTDAETNTFTVGNVKIEQYEKDRNGVDFVQGQTLIPIVGSAGLTATEKADESNKGFSTTAKNYIDKIVTVKNTGASNAYVRVFVAIPVFQYSTEVDPADASANVLHWNFGMKFQGGQWTPTCDIEGCWNWGKNLLADQYPGGDINDWNVIGDIIIDGINYDVYCITYESVLAPGAETPAVMKGLYLDNRVDFNGTNYTITIEEGTPKVKVTKVITGLNGTAKVLVATQAVQADGFTDPFVALDTAFKAFTATNNPFYVAP